MSTARQALDDAVAGWNAGDLERYLTMYDEGIRLHGYTPEPMGKDEVRAFYEQTMAAFDRPRLDFHEVLWDGDKATVRFTLSGRHVGEYLGVPPTHSDIALPGITILHFADGRVVERWSSADMLGLLVQLGAVPAPPAATPR